MAIISSLYVIKIGSSTVLSGGKEIYKEIEKISSKGHSIIIVAGGAEGIEKHYQNINREIRYLDLANGNEVRYCSAEEMKHIYDAYNNTIIPTLKRELEDAGLKTYIQCGSDNNVVQGKQGPPLKVKKNNKNAIVRDSLYGNYQLCDTSLLYSLLNEFDVVCLTPPILGQEKNQLLNIDADVLAANISIQMKAHHLRFVTGTNGILKDVNSPYSTVKDIYKEDNLSYVKGRMKQKVRAARLAIQEGINDVCITGPTMCREHSTWFWDIDTYNEELDLINKVIRIPSVSYDESELANYLNQNIKIPFVKNEIDPAGNVVFQKGTGPYTLMLLGHIDTVPHLWKVENNNERITGRGVVDAKGCFVNFLQMLKDVEVPADCQLKVIGAVEEEVSSSAGAYYVRDNYKADAVIIGEPSGENNLTLGYHGLLKLGVTIEQEQKHSASKNNLSVADHFYKIRKEMENRVGAVDPDNVSTITKVTQYKDANKDVLKGIINFRISPNVENDYIKNIDLKVTDDVTIEVLRSTPGYLNKRNCTLVKSFVKSFANKGEKCNYLKKTGTSDMNTLATNWVDVPIVAYGPGDSTLDHTNEEFLNYKEIESARGILKDAIHNWFSKKTEVV